MYRRQTHERTLPHCKGSMVSSGVLDNFLVITPSLRCSRFLCFFESIFWITTCNCLVILKSYKSYSFQFFGSWVDILNVPYHLNWKLEKKLYIFKSDFFCRPRRRINFSDHRKIRGFFVPPTDKKLFQLWLSSVSSRLKITESLIQSIVCVI